MENSKDKLIPILLLLGIFIMLFRGILWIDLSGSIELQTVQVVVVLAFSILLILLLYILSTDRYKISRKRSAKQRIS